MEVQQAISENQATKNKLLGKTGDLQLCVCAVLVFMLVIYKELRGSPLEV